MAKIKVFYRPEMFVYDKTKPIGLWKGEDVMRLVKADSPVIMDFNPVSEEALLQVHDKKYVNDVLTRTIENGYHSKSAQQLQAILWACGSHMAATREARISGIAFSPTSGFHHAKFASGGGYCTFNGLMLSVMSVRSAMPDAKILIIDGDAHYGDGITDIVHKLLVQGISYITASKSTPAEMNAMIRELVPRHDLVMYQAGVDCHFKDPLCSDRKELQLTTEDLRERDTVVFETCKKHKVPVVWNLAGGYSPTGTLTTMLHYFTWSVASRVYAQDPQS